KRTPPMGGMAGSAVGANGEIFAVFANFVLLADLRTRRHGRELQCLPDSSAPRSQKVKSLRVQAARGADLPAAGLDSNGTPAQRYPRARSTCDCGGVSDHEAALDTWAQPQAYDPGVVVRSFRRAGRRPRAAPCRDPDAAEPGRSPCPLSRLEVERAV